MALKQQRLDFVFSPIYKEEREINAEKEFAALGERLELERSRAKKEVFKQPVGRPRRECQAVLLKPKIEKMKQTSTNVRGSYTNWFTPTLWPPIYTVVRQHCSIGGAWNYLKSTYKKPGDLYCVYDKLAKSSMREWFHSNGDLKDTYKHCVDFGTYFVKSNQHCPILAFEPTLKDEICTILRKQRKAGQPLYAVCIQPLIKAIILEKVPHLLEGNHQTSFKVSYEWTKNFVKTELTWSYRVATTTTGKLSKDFEEQGKAMVQRCAYLVKVHNIPPELIMNTDQTGIHLVSSSSSKTWKTKGSKHVKVHGIEDKRQITVAVSSATNGSCLPFQAIFQGTTSKCLSKFKGYREECKLVGWNITYSYNHWSTIETYKEFVEKVLSPYRDLQLQILNLPSDQEMIWLINYRSVYISKEFREWMKTHYSRIHIFYIPANCTSIYQPADVILQRPFKHAFHQEFNKYTMNIITKQLKRRENIHMDFKMSKLKPNICEWLYKSWLNLSFRTDMIIKGWMQTGLLRSLDKEFQKQAMMDNMISPLFKTSSQEDVQAYNKECNEEIDTDINLTTILEDNLTRVAALPNNISSNRIRGIRELARKTLH